MFASHWIDPPRTGLGLSASHPSRPLPRPRWRAPMLPRRNERRATTLTRRSSATPWPRLPHLRDRKGPEGGFRGRPGHPQQAADEDPPQVHEEDPQGEGGAHAAGQVLRLQPPPPLPQEGAGQRRGPSPESRLTRRQRRQAEASLAERGEGMVERESGGEARWRRRGKADACAAAVIKSQSVHKRKFRKRPGFSTR